jgi:uncharacterized protein HemX
MDDQAVEERARELIKQALPGINVPLQRAEMRNIATEVVSGCQDCNRHIASQRLAITTAIIILAGTLVTSVLNFWAQHTNSVVEKENSAHYEAMLEKGMSGIQQQINQLNRRMGELQDKLKSDKDELERRWSSRPMQRVPDTIVGVPRRDPNAITR